MMNYKILPFLPFVALAIIYFLNKFPILEKIKIRISPLFAILFLIGSLYLRGYGESYLNILDIFRDLKIAFGFSAHMRLFCLLLGLFWFLTAVYSARYFAITGDKKSSQFEMLFLTIIGLLASIILSKNLISAALFYQLLAFAIYLMLNLFSSKNSAPSIKNFATFIIISASIMFLNALLTFAISGSNQFSPKGIFTLNEINIWQFSYLLFFYFIAIISFIFLPFYFLFRNLHYLNPLALMTGLMGFSFAILAILYKIIFFVFDIKLFAHFMEQINSGHVLTIIIALNLLSFVILALRSENLKQIIILLFFNQLTLAIMSLILIGLNFKKSQILIGSFLLSQMIIFFVLANITLCLKEAENRSLNGIFYRLRITILALIFAFINLAGLIPAAGMFEKYWLFRDIMINESWLHGAIIGGNIILLLTCGVKIIYPMLEILKRDREESHGSTASPIETDLNLISPMVILPIALFLLILFK